MQKIIYAGVFVLAAVSVASADPIATFQQLCIANAGNTDAISAAGAKAGFKVIKIGSGAMGVRKKTDETLQINIATKHKFECAVTTPDMPNPQKVSKRFFKSIGLKPKAGGVRASLNGKTYTFLHDTNDGEAFVMFSD